MSSLATPTAFGFSVLQELHDVEVRSFVVSHKLAPEEEMARSRRVRHKLVGCELLYRPTTSKLSRAIGGENVNSPPVVAPLPSWKVSASPVVTGETVPIESFASTAEGAASPHGGGAAGGGDGGDGRNGGDGGGGGLGGRAGGNGGHFMPATLKFLNEG